MYTSDDYWLTRPDVATRLKIPIKTLAKWGSEGVGPPYAKMGRFCRYKLSDVIAWEEAQYAAVASND
ncbi:hypothetical protein AN948_14020 [Rhodococcus sp. ADH]|uniref:helix-turn-helix transcriptional regulator n=1 Tax=Rhodococcus sp. ADH TaxID=224843 RepID=UPI0006BA4D83|nr:helix-turn-helix domain-containing protein [Rhodococcus sp. ADH]KPH18949.1 hypothetical protein AN948_14020 [Rhodococcus sp. ADH]